MIDPLLVRILEVGFGLMWLAAAWHKFAAHRSFRELLADYRLLPAGSLVFVGWLVPAVEAALAAAWLLAFWPLVTVAATAVILAAYATAIAINLLRGRRHIACGCSLSPDAGGLSLSWTLVLRNLLLVPVAAITLLPQTLRPLSIADHVLLVLALLVAMLLHTAGMQLLRNRGAFQAWSKAHE